MQFQSARLKLERANEHIAEVEKRISLVASPNAQTIWVEDDLNSGVKFIHYRLDRFADLRDIALILGDAIHNIRSVLDHSWYATLGELAPTLISLHTRFPVDRTPESLKARLEGIDLHVIVPALFKLVMVDIKPYEGGDWFIRHLHDLDIRDKHQLLIPTINKVKPIGLRVKDHRGSFPVGSHGEERGGEFSVAIPPKLEIEEKGSVAVEIVLKEGSLEVEEVGAMLHRFAKRVSDLMELLERFVEFSK